MKENLGYLPASVVAGETIWIAEANLINSWAGKDIEIASITPALGYTLSYDVAATIPITVAAVANVGNDGWTLTFSASQTLLWSAGNIRFAGYATHTSSARKFAVDTGIIRVSASPLTVSTWSAALTALDAAIATYAANPHGSFTIGGDFQVTYRSLKELIDLRAFITYEINKETSTCPKRKILSRFI